MEPAWPEKKRKNQVPPDPPRNPEQVRRWYEPRGLVGFQKKSPPKKKQNKIVLRGGSRKGPGSKDCLDTPTGTPGVRKKGDRWRESGGRRGRHQRRKNCVRRQRKGPKAKTGLDNGRRDESYPHQESATDRVLFHKRLPKSSRVGRHMDQRTTLKG